MSEIEIFRKQELLDQKTFENSFIFCCVKLTLFSLNFIEYMIRLLAILALSDIVYKMPSSNLVYHLFQGEIRLTEQTWCLYRMKHWQEMGVLQ